MKLMMIVILIITNLIVGGCLELIFAQSPIIFNLVRIIDGKDAGLVLERVPEVWNEGYFGQGVLIASIDEDFNWGHPDLVNQIWNNLAEDFDGDGKTIEWNGSRWVLDPGDLNGVDDDGNGYIDDLIGWDFVDDDNNVSRNDATSHGTEVAGVLVGDGSNGVQTGIAPQAKLMLLRIGTNSEQEQWYAWEAMQYAIDMKVDIISQSQSFHWDDTWCQEDGSNCGEPDLAKFREMAELELAAGIIHFSSISNDGLLVGGNDVPIPFNISVPGNLPPAWLHPDQTLIGGLTAMMGIGNVDAWHPNEIHSTSPYGASEHFDYPYNPGMGLLKPDITAYGASTESTNGRYPNYNYDGFSGTSSATPHAAGVAALLLSVNPDLTPSDLCRILKLSSIDNGASGHDNRYGAGTVDAYEAYLMTVNEVPVSVITKFAIIGDYGDDNSNEQDVADLVNSWNVDFIITTGDNSYGSTSIDNNIGKYYSDWIGNYNGSYGNGAISNNFYPSLGNHDYTDGGGITTYLNYFTLPGNERNYDVVRGNVHIFIVDSYNRSGSEALLQTQMENCVQNHFHWRVISFHYPPYSSGSHGNTSSMQWAFKDWGAHFVVSGHDHNYERLNIGGLTYFVNGAGGRPLRSMSSTISGSEARYNSKHGAQLVVADGIEIIIKFYNKDGTLIDSKTIIDEALPVEIILLKAEVISPVVLT